MRLVDADTLIFEGQQYSKMQLKGILEFMEKQPTAYDVEKVVEQLQQQANQYNRRALELVEKSTEAGIHNKGKACSYEHAINIVRKGGVE